MEELGAEVSQKMRSAVKAKLMELGCYVDNELPDYIMVMVANKRTKSQMSADLQLFLAGKTEVFVDWLSIVLKKLKEVTVTNPEIYKKVSKQKIDDSTKSEVKINAKVKKEKKNKSRTVRKTKIKNEMAVEQKKIKSLTDDLPISADSLSEKRKIVIAQENQRSRNLEISEDSFDIPPLSAAGVADDSDLEEIHRKIKSVKSRLGLHVHSDDDDDDDADDGDDFLHIKLETDDLNQEDEISKNGHSSKDILQSTVTDLRSESNSPIDVQDKIKHPRIVFVGDESSESKKRSVLERLGKRQHDDSGDDISPKRSKSTTVSDDIQTQKEDVANNDTNVTQSVSVSKKIIASSPRESALKRLGVMSKVAVPEKKQQVVEPEVVVAKEVPSAIKVKPRPPPPRGAQANKNLLLKAVAEAQRSIAQTPLVGSMSKPDALFTKKFKTKLNQPISNRKLLVEEKDKLKTMLINLQKDNSEYIPKPINEIEPIEYIPSHKGASTIAQHSDNSDNTTKTTMNQQFIITLDGIERAKSSLKIDELSASPNANDVKSKTHTQIVFDLDRTDPVSEQSLRNISPVKNKEKCRYWPACKQGNKCEFVHSSTPCKAFPQCKFGDRCLYIHPSCKFESSCTRKDCPYSHTTSSFNSVTPTTQVCKYFPNCNNSNCGFYHPKTCKFGKHCKNKGCTYSHTFYGKSGNLTWRPSL